MVLKEMRFRQRSASDQLASCGHELGGTFSFSFFFTSVFYEARRRRLAHKTHEPFAETRRVGPSAVFAQWLTRYTEALRSLGTEPFLRRAPVWTALGFASPATQHAKGCHTRNRYGDTHRTVIVFLVLRWFSR